MSRKLAKQIIGQSLISPIAAPPKPRQSAWMPPDRSVISPPITPTDSHDRQSSISSRESADQMHSADFEASNEYVSLMAEANMYSAFSNCSFSSWEPMDLPNELLPKILRFLDRKSLGKLITVNKAWAQVIIPLLYSHLTFKKSSFRQLKGLTQHLQEYHQKYRVMDISYISLIQTLQFIGIVYVFTC